MITNPKNMDNYELGEDMDIHTACSLGYEGFVKEIINSNTVNVDTKNACRWTPLMYASWGGHKSVVELLLQSGAKKSQLNSSNQTALMLAVRSGSLPLVQLVFERCILDLTDYYGKTALYYAVEFNCLEIAKYLITQGASMNLNCHGKTHLPAVVRSLPCEMVMLSPQSPIQVSPKPTQQGHTGGKDLKKFLESISLEKYWPQFQSHNVDFEKFLKMDEDDLKSIGINLLGPRRKMYLAIKAYSKAKI